MFLRHVGQTSDFPLSLEIEKASGVYLHAADGKKYFDLISGVSVSNIGHCHPEVVAAVNEQASKYMHLMVYGEYIQSPQVELATELAKVLPAKLESSFFVNSGSEANEGALKLAKRYTGRFEIISFRDAYHGGTHGAMSLMSDEQWTRPFRPLLPGVKHLDYNCEESLSAITDKTACVVVEAVQAEGGVIFGTESFMHKLRQRCDETGALLVFDEVQTGFGRTGELFGFMHFGIVPDIITIAKGMGGGMPVGAFVSSNEIMSCLKSDPILGHITTFGGHPVSCAAALASLKVIVRENLHEEAKRKEKLFKDLMVHPAIRSIRGKGLLLALELGSFEKVDKLMQEALKEGVVLDWFLFCNTFFRIAPPLNITDEEIKISCEKIKKALDRL